MDRSLQAALIGGVAGVITGYAMGKGLSFGLRRRGGLEHAFIIVEGRNVDHAFRRGKCGKGVRLRDHTPPTKLFETYFQDLALGSGVQEDPEQATLGFFTQQDGWETADDAGIVLRWSARTEPLHLSTGMVLRHGYLSGADIYATGESLTARMTESIRTLSDRVMASLTDPGEPLDGSGQFPPTDLGPEPEFTAVCVRAIAIMCLGENPEGKAAVLELPLSRSLWSRLLRRRRFLFFGTRAVS